ncbi:histidinol-phosphatase [Marinilabiliaceae bacterium ANBcel2]|nr:histidinol-phosphatase [Marinilabiliaceae bacterium ANBcel2]
MSWSSYHSHCYYCDGKGSPSQYIKEAIDKGVKVLGFSSHAPVPFKTDWTMPVEKLPEYLQRIDELKLKHYGDLLILKSLEVDYIPGVTGVNHPLIKNSKLDYTIGSVHYVDKFKNGDHWSIDDSFDDFLKGVTYIFDGNVKRAVERYFELQQEMLNNQPPDILGHMDKIRFHNLVGFLFDEKQQWYKNMVYDTLILAKEKGVIVEINTKYYERADLFFPSKNHFKWMHQNGIPVTINSDVHNPEKVIAGFREAASLLLESDYKEVWEWSGSGFEPVSLTKKGVLFSDKTFIDHECL